MNVHTTTPFDRGVQELDRAIAQARGVGAERILSTRVLAANAGISLVTMNRVIGNFVVQRKLVTVAGLGVFLPDAQRVRVQKDLAGSSGLASEPCGWYRVYRAIKKDLQNGRYESGHVFAARKELSFEHGVSPRAVSRALLKVCAEGSIEPWKRTFRTPLAKTRHLAASIALVVPGFKPGVPQNAPPHIQLAQYPRMTDNFRALEQVCFEQGIRLLMFLHDYERDLWYENGQRISLDKEFFAQGSLLGAVIWNIGVSPENLTRTCLPFAASKLRVVLLEEGGNEGDIRRMFPSFAVLMMGTSERNGFLAGEYLARLGHRQVLYLAPLHSSFWHPWSHRRLDGLTSAFALSRYNGKVLPLTRESVHTPFNIAQYENIWSSTLLPLLQASMDLQSLTDAAPLINAFDNNQQLLAEIMASEELFCQCQTLMQQALDMQGCSAWVCQNDTVALMALRFLHNKGVAVPGDISVLGFDNTPLARAHRLTSCDFAPIQASRLMVNAIAGSRSDWESLFSRSPFELDGHIEERDTVALITM